MNRIQYAIVCTFFALFGSVPGNVEAQSFSDIPSTEAARRVRADTIFAPIEPEWAQERELVTVPGSSPVLFRTNQQQGNRYYVFIPAGDDSMHLVSPGTYIVRRRIEDGEIDQIKIFLQHHEGTFLRVFPEGRSVRMDVYVVGNPIYRDIPISIGMRRAVTAPLTMIRDGSGGIVDWSFLDIQAAHTGYQTIQTMVERIRSALPTLPDAEDGAMNAAGELVFIESLRSQEALPGFNCSGFAKWVVDGIYRQRTGRYLSIDPLKRKHVGSRGTSWTEPLEDARDPYFGLDWTRNLAVEMEALDRGIDPATIGPETLDVRDVPYARYFEDVGYRVESLRAVLYWLARTEPGTFYLGSVNRLFGSDPVLRQHTHVVAFFPYFDADGRFEVAVMERNVETSVDSLERRYRNDFIHLVRVQGNADFKAPQILIRAPD